MYRDGNAEDSKTKYNIEVSYHENPRNKKKYVVLKEREVAFCVVQDMIEDVLEKVSRGSAELRHILVYTSDDPEFGI